MIDLVVPMVFPQDLEWQELYARYKGNGRAAMRHVRYRSWGTEELLVRCCMKYLPWLRRIYILLAQESQKKSLPLPPPVEGVKGPEIEIVYHRDFIPEKYLPCFSSPCIEMFLHRIPGLSEHFIYANDDMFPLSPMREEDFFQPAAPSNSPGEAPSDSPGGGENGVLACLHFKEAVFPAKPSMFERKCMYQLNMIGAPFGKHYSKTWIETGHSFAPILKSSCQEVWRRHGEEIIRYLSPLKRNDRSYNHYIYLLYQYFAGLSVDHAPRMQYIGKKTPTAQLPAILLDPHAGIVCLNDNEDIADWERRAKVVRSSLQGKAE